MICWLKVKCNLYFASSSTQLMETDGSLLMKTVLLNNDNNATVHAQSPYFVWNISAIYLGQF